jgi:hypothetical protein
MGSSSKLTVHSYINEEGPTLSYSSAAATLEHGRDLVHAASSSLGWREPIASFNERLFGMLFISQLSSY